MANNRHRIIFCLMLFCCSIHFISFVRLCRFISPFNTNNMKRMQNAQNTRNTETNKNSMITLMANCSVLYKLWHRLVCERSSKMLLEFNVSWLFVISDMFVGCCTVEIHNM